MTTTPPPTVTQHGLPRELRDHQIDDTNRQIHIYADEPDPDTGEASHRYTIVFDEVNIFPLDFQHGPIGEDGLNGITNETLLAIVIDRLVGFQTGKLAHPHNDVALSHCRHALHALQSRTQERIERGVEGTKIP